MQHKRTYWRFFAVHIITGWAFSLLLSLGVTFWMAASNMFLLVMAAAVPIMDYVVSKRRVKWLTEEDEEDVEDEEDDTEEKEKTTLSTNRIVVLCVIGFGLGMLLNLVMLFTVFS